MEWLVNLRQVRIDVGPIDPGQRSEIIHHECLMLPATDEAYIVERRTAHDMLLLKLISKTTLEGAQAKYRR